MSVINMGTRPRSPNRAPSSGPARPVVRLAVLGVVVLGASWLAYQAYRGSDTALDASTDSTAAKGDFWQRPGARAVGSETMQNIPSVSAQAAGTLAAVDGATKALARPNDMQVDASGHLRVNRALRNHLDTTLGWTDGPITVEAIERARQKLRQQLTGTALSEALGTLERYVAYRNTAEEQARTSVTPALPPGMGVLGEATQLQRRMALRSQLLDTDMRAAFFGDEEALDQYRLTVLQLQTMGSFTEAERAEQLKPLWQKLPAHLRSQIPAP